MSNVVVDIYITPIGTAGTSLSNFVAEAEKVLKNYPQIKTQLNPMSTTLEGELDVILKVIREMHEAPFNRGAWRVSTTIRIDDRRDGHTNTIKSRLESVTQKLK